MALPPILMKIAEEYEGKDDTAQDIYIVIFNGINKDFSSMCIFYKKFHKLFRIECIAYGIHWNYLDNNTIISCYDTNYIKYRNHLEEVYLKLKKKINKNPLPFTNIKNYIQFLSF